MKIATQSERKQLGCTAILCGTADLEAGSLLFQYSRGQVQGQWQFSLPKPPGRLRAQAARASAPRSTRTTPSLELRPRTPQDDTRDRGPRSFVIEACYDLHELVRYVHLRACFGARTVEHFLFQELPVAGLSRLHQLRHTTLMSRQSDASCSADTRVCTPQSDTQAVSQTAAMSDQRHFRQRLSTWKDENKSNAGIHTQRRRRQIDDSSKMQRVCDFQPNARSQTSATWCSSAMHGQAESAHKHRYHDTATAPALGDAQAADSTVGLEFDTQPRAREQRYQRSATTSRDGTHNMQKINSKHWSSCHSDQSCKSRNARNDACLTQPKPELRIARLAKNGSPAPLAAAPPATGELSANNTDITTQRRVL